MENNAETRIKIKAMANNIMKLKSLQTFKTKMLISSEWLNKSESKMDILINKISAQFMCVKKLKIVKMTLKMLKSRMHLIGNQ